MKMPPLFSLAACLWFSLPAVAAPLKGQTLTPKLAPIERTSEKPAISNAPILLQPAKPITLADQPKQPRLPVINCRLPVGKVGTLSLSSAEAIISGGTVEIRESYMDPRVTPLLRGRVLRVDAAGTGDDTNRQMSGLVFFQEGTMLGQLNEQPADAIATAGNVVDDLVFRSQGSLSGQILEARSEELLLRDRGGLRRIPIDSITYVRSPHAFLFTITGTPTADLRRTQVQSVVFQPTTSATPLSNSLVVGHPADPLDDLDDIPVDNISPAAKRLESIHMSSPMQAGSRPFGSWP